VFVEAQRVLDQVQIKHVASAKSRRARSNNKQKEAGLAKATTSNMSKCRYFEHVPEYSVAACQECRYAVWPNQIEGHLQEQHKTSRKEAEVVGQQVRSWTSLTQYPSELEIPSGIPRPVQQLPVYTDGLLCQLDAGSCLYITRSKECMRKHWQRQHQWSAGKKRGRPSQIKEKRLQAQIEQGHRPVHCQRLFGSRHGSQYFEVQLPSQDQEGLSTVPTDGSAA
jgi:hypothetical protein